MITTFQSLRKGAALLTLLSLLTSQSSLFAVAIQGQNKGDTNNWFSVNLQGWVELDYIPCREYFPNNSAGSQTVTIDFPHLTGTTPGFEDLTGFTAFTTNIVITSGPTLITDPSGTWTYQFTVNITDNNPAEIRFFARLTAGSHANVGSSLKLTGSGGVMQIHKPGVGPGLPDLAITKRGPASIAQGGIITYTLSYTNKAATNTAVGTQISDILPPQITVDTNSLPPNSHLVGNTLFIDLMDVAAHASGQVSFQAMVAIATPVGTVISNYSQILCSQDDANFLDNNSTWTTTVTAGCLVPPIGCVPNKTVEMGTVWSFDPPATSDPSANSSLTILSTVTNTTGHCDGTFDATRTWRATDACGNTGQCSQTVTVVDTTAPVISCGNTNKSVQVGTPWDFDPPTATDNSGTNNISIVSTVTNTTGHCDGTFDATRMWQATDICGNSAQCRQTVNVIDTTAPVITCSSTNKTVQLGTAWSFDPPTATDNSGSNVITVISTVTNTAGHCTGTFDATRTWQATDACGNSAQCSQTVNVIDTTAPVITCSSNNKTVQLGAAWSFDPPTATDNSGSNLITVVSTVTNTAGHCTGTFDTTRTWQATDACGNSAQCSQTVNVIDTTAPVITCSSTNKTVQLGIAWSFDPPTATDNSGSNIITVVSTVTNTAGHCTGTFDATRTWQATDACGNSGQCSQTVNVIDTTAPVITCSSTNKTVQLGIAWSFDPPTATDNSGSNVITVVSTVTNTAGHCTGTFDATRTWQAADACGNSAQCSQTVNVIDTTAPVITCSSNNKTVQLGAAWSFDPPTATDNSGSNLITVVSTVTNTAGHCTGTFDTTRTWQATDACGNSAQCSQMVNVIDTTAPVITCSSTNKTVQLGTAWSFDPPTATDNSGSNVITVVSTITNTAGQCTGTFDATRTWQATDACGNSAQCSQTVNVIDTTAPVITCSSTNKTVQLGTAWSFDPPTATDNSGSNVITVVSTVTNTAGHCTGTFDTTRTWQATDACGNFARCNQAVTIVDTTAPIINCIATNKVVSCGTAWSFDPPTATDNSGSNVITVVSTVTNTANHCGSTYDATRTWQATDACGNFARCSQIVSVIDTTAPTITCTDNKSVELGTAWSFDQPTASDVCSAVTINILGTVTNLGCGNSLSATRTWQATDACGNSAQCSQTVNVIDTTPPSVSIATPTNGSAYLAPAMFTVMAHASDGAGTISKVEFFLGGTKIGEATNGDPYYVVVHDLPAASNYTFTAKATDGCGLTTVSAPVSIYVMSSPPMAAGPAILDPQTGFFKQHVRVTNPTSSMFGGVRIYISNLTNMPPISVYNATGQTNGIPYVDTITDIMPGTYVDLTIIYYSPNRVAPNPVLQAQLIPMGSGGAAAINGVQQHVYRGVMLPNGSFMIVFMSNANRVYSIQYSSDLKSWKAAQPSIAGTGNWILFVDDGQPTTDSLPGTTQKRFYRLMMLP